MKKINIDLAIWGHPPPPYGGMTVHISRLLPKLKNGGITYRLYKLSHPDIPTNEYILNYSRSKIKWLLHLLFGQIEDVHYVMSGKANVRLVAVIIGVLRRKKIILRIGGESLINNIKKGFIYKRMLVPFALKYSSAIICVSNVIYKQAISHGAHPQKTFMVPGFIPPVTNDNHCPPKMINDFLRIHTVNLLITGVISEATKRDIYGFWDTLSVFSRILEKNTDIGLIMFIQQNRNIQLLQAYLKDKNLTNNILLYTENDELWPTMRKCNVFLRSTKTDGDANSIREALYLHIPVIASDCVPRPKPVVTYKDGSLGDYYNKLEHMINNLKTYQETFKDTIIQDNSNEIVRIIRSLKSL
jgi:glycosyltransferase involved in cell wall biosynthesis